MRARVGDVSASSAWELRFSTPLAPVYAICSKSRYTSSARSAPHLTHQGAQQWLCQCWWQYGGEGEPDSISQI